MKRIVLLTVLLLLSVGFVFSVDFGFLLDQKFELENGEDYVIFSYTPGLTPWFSWNGGKGLSVFLSAYMSLRYNTSNDDIDDNDGFLKPVFFPEISRFEVMYRSGQLFAVEAGRIFYSDVFGMTAAGLFDGARFDLSLPLGNISIGAYYSGLQYKETAKISMTGSDAENNGSGWEYDSFGDYFASKRVIASVRWDLPIFQFSSISAEVLAQFDVNGKDDKLHSQYGEVQFELYPVSKIGLNFGLLFEAMENGEGDFFAAFGALAGLRMEVPGALNDGLKVLLKFSSGSYNDTFASFTPMTAASQGMVFPGVFSGLGVISANYSIRILPSLFAEGILSYFIRTFTDDYNDGTLYGGELWTSIAYQPFDDVRVSLAGGLFFPALGNYYSSGTKPSWKISSVLSLSF